MSEPEPSEPIRTLRVGRWSARLLPRQPYESRYTADQPALGFSFDTQSGTHAIASDRVTPFLAMPNGLAYVPVGCDVYSRSRLGGEYLVLTGFDPGADLGDGADEPFRDRVDARAVGAARTLRRMFLASPSGDALTCEAAFLALLDRLRWHRGRRPDRRDPARWMTPARLRMAFDVIEAKLGAALTVQDVADALGLSAGFFSRAFRAATGLPPHAYIIDRRLAMARAALAGGARDLSALALDAGFSSHAHLAAQFRQRFGVSPRAFRESLTVCPGPAMR
jgi:AraC family transcriptional regulator